MKTIFSTILFVLFLTGCSSVNLSKNSIEPKNKLIQKANNGNIQAMIKLNKYYKFPLTKEGLYYFNNWYKTIDKNDNPQDINNIAGIYYKYNDMFVNGEKRALKLYEISSSLGNIDADIAHINLLVNSYQTDKLKKIEDKIFDLLDEEQLNQLYNVYKNKYYYLKNRVRIIQRMKEKGYKIPFHNTLENIKESVNQKAKIALYNTTIDEVLEQKNPKNIYELAFYLQNVYQQRDKALFIYKELLKIDPSNHKIYANMATIYSKKAYRNDKKKNKALALKYYEKASLLGNEESSKKLLTLYSKNSKDVDKFFSVKNRLLKTKKGQLAVAKYYQKKKLYIKSNQIFEELANKGNKEAILNLALTIESKYNFNPDVYKTGQKWQKIIESIEDPALEEKYISALLKHKYRRGYKDILLSYIQKNSKRINILTLRKLAESYKYSEPKKAFYYYKTAIDAEDAKSIKELAKFYLYSKKHKNFNKAVETYNILVKKGDISATKKLAQIYIDPPYSFKKLIDVKKGLEYYESLANKGDIYAIRKLKEAYLCGACTKGDVVDYKKGFMYLKKLEHLGLGKDSTGIAWLYSIGKGVKKDLLKAKEYYEKAKKQGYQGANYYLASLYFKNKNILANPIYIDYKKALEYLKDGAKYHHEGCINLLGVFYEKGYGVKKDLEKAAFYYKKIARYNPIVAYRLGIYYKDKKDYKNAEKYFNFSIERRNSASMIELGILYEKGLTGKVNMIKAIELYKKAYEKDKSISAAYNLGLIYHYGKGNTKKDLKLAKYWYKKSSLKQAKKQLTLLSKKSK